MHYALIFVMWASNIGISTNHVEWFADKQACVLAGNVVVKEFSSFYDKDQIKFVCVKQTSDFFPILGQ